MRRVVFPAALACIVFAVLETASLVTMSILQGEWYAYADLAAARTERFVAEPPESDAEVRRQEIARMFFPNIFTVALHPYLGFSLAGTGTLSGDPVQSLAALGFHDKLGVFVRGPDPGRTVVGIFGGSVAQNFAWSREAKDILRTRLGEHPAFRGTEIVFTAPALGGYKQPQQLLALSYLLSLGAHFDLLITLDGFNEVALPPQENIPAGVAPFYPRSWHLLAQDRTDPEVLRAAGRVTVLLDRRAELAGWFSVPPLCWSLTSGLLWHLADHIVARDIADARAALALAGGSGGFAVHGPSVPPPGDDDALYGDLARTWASGTRQVHRLAEANAIRSYHFLQPSQYLEGTKPLSAEERSQSYLAGSWVEAAVRAGYPHLQRESDILRGEGVRMTDLTGVFRNHPETLYEDTLVHVSGKGSAIMAEAIADVILADLASAE